MENSRPITPDSAFPSTRTVHRCCWCNLQRRKWIQFRPCAHISAQFKGNWEQVGADIDGEEAADYSGIGVSYRLMAAPSPLALFTTATMAPIQTMCASKSSIKRLGKGTSSAPISPISLMKMAPLIRPPTSDKSVAITTLPGLSWAVKPINGWTHPHNPWSAKTFVSPPPPPML